MLQQARTKHTCCVGSAAQGWQHVRHAPHNETILCDVSRTETNTAHGNTRLGADQRLCGCSHTGSHACARTAARRHLSAREAPHRKQILREKTRFFLCEGPKSFKIGGCNPWEMPKLTEAPLGSTTTIPGLDLQCRDKGKLGGLPICF